MVEPKEWSTKVMWDIRKMNPISHIRWINHSYLDWKPTLKDSETMNVRKALPLFCYWGVQQHWVGVLTVTRPLNTCSIRPFRCAIYQWGQPGWSTHQIVMNLSEFTSWKPDFVLVGVGVRDTQRSNRQDLEASPTPWILHRYSIRWLKSLLKKSKKVGIQTGTTNRVLPKAFKDNLVRIKNAFPKAVVYFYMFPQVSTDKEYAEVVNTVSHIRISEFSRTYSFEHDPIHLNTKGQQVLFEELISLAPILNPWANWQSFSE